MKTHPFDLSLAFAGGVALASMIAANSKLAFYSSPLLASWVAHGIGIAASLGMLMLIKTLPAKTTTVLTGVKLPIWAYLGGIPGAFTVVLAAITVNSPLGLSGSMALMMAGQVLFGFVSDGLGLFGLKKRSITLNDGVAVLLMAAGTVITLFGRASS